MAVVLGSRKKPRSSHSDPDSCARSDEVDHLLELDEGGVPERKSEALFDALANSAVSSLLDQ